MFTEAQRTEFCCYLKCKILHTRVEHKINFYFEQNNDQSDRNQSLRSTSAPRWHKFSSTRKYWRSWIRRNLKHTQLKGGRFVSVEHSIVESWKKMTLKLQCLTLTQKWMPVSFTRCLMSQSLQQDSVLIIKCFPVISYVCLWCVWKM